MKWLWIGFAVMWAMSVVLDSRRRNRALRIPDGQPAAPKRGAPLPALLAAKTAQ